MHRRGRFYRKGIIGFHLRKRQYSEPQGISGVEMATQLLETGRRRVWIQDVTPEIDGGEFAIKRIVGQRVVVSADVLTDGHDQVACLLKHRMTDEPVWSEVPMEPLGNDRWQAGFDVSEVRRYRYTIEAWVDHLRTWQESLRKRIGAGQEIGIELRVGAELVKHRAGGPAAQMSNSLRHGLPC